MATKVSTAVEGRAQLGLVVIAILLAFLTLLKFVVVKPVMFLLLAVLFGVAAVLVQQRRAAGRWLLSVLCLVTAVVFGAHLFDKGFDASAYQNNADYVMVVLDFPIAVVGVVPSALSLRSRVVRPEN